ncbi:MAG: flippase-like domain-containing protein [Cyclobacteriaceae bacterium]
MINKKALAQFVKTVILVLCFGFIFNKLSEVELDFSAFFFPTFLPIFLIVLLLMPVNWCLEALRWQISLPEEKIPFRESLKIVLRGLAMNWMLPFATGDLTSRITESRGKKISMVALGYNRLTILFITVVYGAFSIAFFTESNDALYYLAPLLSVLLLVLILIISRNSFLGLPTQFLNSFIAWRVVLLTLLRYCIFTLQFYLLISFFNPDLSSFIVTMGIGWVFMFRSFIPSLFGNLGVREASSILFFQPYIEDLSLIMLPCLLIWLINTVIPSLVGVIPIITFRPKLS